MESVEERARTILNGHLQPYVTTDTLERILHRILPVLNGVAPRTRSSKRPNIIPFHIVSVPAFAEQRNLVVTALCEILDLEKQEGMGNDGEIVCHTPCLVRYPTEVTHTSTVERINGRDMHPAGYTPQCFMDYLGTAVKLAEKSKDKCIVLHFSRFDEYDRVTRDIVLRLLNDDGVIYAANWSRTYDTVQIPQNIHCIVCLESGYGAPRLEEVKKSPLHQTVVVEAAMWQQMQRARGAFYNDSPVYVIMRSTEPEKQVAPSPNLEERLEQLRHAEQVFLLYIAHRIAPLEQKLGVKRIGEVEEELFLQRLDEEDSLVIARELAECEQENCRLHEILKSTETEMRRLYLRQEEDREKREEKKDEMPVRKRVIPLPILGWITEEEIEEEEEEEEEEREKEREETKIEASRVTERKEKKTKKEKKQKEGKKAKREKKEKHKAIEGAKEKRKRISVSETTLIDGTSGWVSRQRQDRHYSLKCRCGASVRSDNRTRITNHEKECHYHQSHAITTQ